MHEMRANARDCTSRSVSRRERELLADVLVPTREPSAHSGTMASSNARGTARTICLCRSARRSSFRSGAHSAIVSRAHPPELIYRNQTQASSKTRHSRSTHLGPLVSPVRLGLIVTIRACGIDFISKEGSLFLRGCCTSFICLRTAQHPYPRSVGDLLCSFLWDSTSHSSTVL